MQNYVMVSIVRQIDITLRVTINPMMLSVIMMSVIMMSVIMMSVIMMSVIMMNVMAPLNVELSVSNLPRPST